MKNSKILLTLTILSALLGLSLIFGGVNLLQSQTPDSPQSPLAPTIAPDLPDSPNSPNLPNTIKVLRVIDGDTFELEDKTTVRLIGVDTPETKDPRRPVGCFGAEASNETKKLIEGKSVRLEKDVSETDKYQRLLRYVYLGDIFINEYLVKQGFAKASTYPPDVKYQGVFRQAETEAREQKRGLWSSCSSSGSNPPTPSVLAAASSPASDCTIKGNVSANGDKIYHLPGQRYYDKTQIDTNLGEHWFCSEAEAEAAGWRKSKV